MNTPKANATDAVPFDKIVGEIKADSQKRSRGRPKKSETLSPGVSSVAGVTGSPASSAPLVGGLGSVSTAIAPSNVPAELIGTTLRAISNIPATRLKNPAYLIDEKQALEDGKTLKPSVDLLIDKWLPHVGPYALEFSFIAAIGAIVFRQYQAGAEFKESQYAKPDKPSDHFQNKNSNDDRVLSGVMQ